MIAIGLLSSNEVFMLYCKDRHKIIDRIGKSFSDFSEKDWDTLFAHTCSCPICEANHTEADAVLDKYLAPAIRDYYLKNTPK